MYSRNRENEQTKNRENEELIDNDNYKSPTEESKTYQSRTYKLRKPNGLHHGLDLIAN